MTESKKQIIEEINSVELNRKTLLLCDLVGSTKIVQDIGDEQSVKLFNLHNRLARDLLNAYEGREIDKTDGFLLLFDSPQSAVKFSFAYHRGLKELSEKNNISLQARIGIHHDDVILTENIQKDIDRGAKPIEIEGLAKPLAARVMSAALGNQTLLTKQAFDVARQEMLWGDHISWLAHGAYMLKGIDDPVEIYEVGEKSIAPLFPPPNSAKIKRCEEEDAILGWRPGAGQPIIGNDDYILKSKLGAGGFGEVWLARNKITEKLSAFKFCFDADQLRSLRREAVLFKVLKKSLQDRDDIAQILSWSFDTAPYYLESEFTPEGNLKEWTQKQGGLQNIDLQTRLNLVAQIAEALGFAHSVGVLHKDIKPENVLVYETDDGDPRIRLCDFGIGQVTDEKHLVKAGVTMLGLTEHNLSASYSSLSGTRLYMSPERLEGKPSSIQEDCFAVGVMLYQVVIGNFDRVLGIGWEREIDDEFLKEDIAVCVDGNPLHRLADIRQLAHRLKTLEKRRTQKQLEETEKLKAAKAIQAVEKGKKRRKFIYAIGLSLGIFLSVVLYQSYRINVAATEARREAKASREVSDFLQNLFMQSDPDQAKGKEMTAREILDQGMERIHSELHDQPLILARLVSVIGNVYLKLGYFEKAKPLLEEGLAIRKRELGESNETVEESYNYLGILHREAGEYAEAEICFKKCLKLCAEKGPIKLSRAYGNLGALQRDMGHLEDADRLLMKSIEIHQKSGGKQNIELADALMSLGAVKYDLCDYEKTIECFEEAYDIQKQCLSEDHPDIARSLASLAAVYKTTGKYEKAESMAIQGLELSRKIYGDAHPILATVLHNLAGVYTAQGDLKKAIAVNRESLEMRKRLYGEDGILVATALYSLSKALRMDGQLDESERLLHLTLDIRKQLGEDHPNYIATLIGLGLNSVAKGNLNEAENYFRDSVVKYQQTFPRGHWYIFMSRKFLAKCLMKQASFEEAESILLDLKQQFSIDKKKNQKRLTEINDILKELYTKWEK